MYKQAADSMLEQAIQEEILSSEEDPVDVLQEAGVDPRMSPYPVDPALTAALIHEYPGDTVDGRLRNAINRVNDLQMGPVLRLVRRL